MKTAIVKFTGKSHYSQARYYAAGVPKLDKESHGDYEKRTWRHKMHTNAEGEVMIPPMAFKNCLSEAAKFLSIRIPGKGQATYTKHFEAGVICMEPVNLGILASEVEGNWLFVPADGVRGGGKRVEKCFPLIRDWGGEVTFMVLDETITVEVFEKVITEAGNLIGIGVFRPKNNGFFGRFKVDEVTFFDKKD